MIWVAPALAFVVSLLVVMAVERHALRLRLIDRPNERSSHVVPRPRGGGLGIIAGTCAGLGVAWLLGVAIEEPVWIVLGAAVLVAAVGLGDDVASLSPWPRLIAQSVAATLVIWTCGGIEHLPLPAPFDYPVGRLGLVLSVIWIVAVTNFFNFMDGADGLAAGQAVLTLGAISLVLWPSGTAVTAVAVLAATLGFLVRNWAPARIFLGDVGSGFLGFLLAASPFAGPLGRRESLLLLVATSLALFLLDPVVTLLRRQWRGAAVTTSHREHLYQQLLDPWQPHGPPVVRLLAAGALLSFLAVAAFWRAAIAWWTLGVALAVFLVEWQAAAARGRRQR